MTRTLASLFGPLQPMALAEDLAAPLLAMPIPEGGVDPAAAGIALSAAPQTGTAARAPAAGPSVPDRFAETAAYNVRDAELALRGELEA
ncbi:hypothetical protein [Cereibacter sphaeroides]|uniref:hypothetical protein n=1 Tax=Cereibacter sphaeroides TaxID=1063 RepID=UPI001E650739|nr:hypothetical protein [Cereibacter sphaeroides]